MNICTKALIWSLIYSKWLNAPNNWYKSDSYPLSMTLKYSTLQNIIIWEYSFGKSQYAKWWSIISCLFIGAICWCHLHADIGFANIQGCRGAWFFTTHQYHIFGIWSHWFKHHLSNITGKEAYKYKVVCMLRQSHVKKLVPISFAINIWNSVVIHSYGKARTWSRQEKFAMTWLLRILWKFLECEFKLATVKQCLYYSSETYMNN